MKLLVSGSNKVIAITSVKVGIQSFVYTGKKITCPNAVRFNQIKLLNFDQTKINSYCAKRLSFSA